MDDKNYNFPEGFLWGASTSSHQVEGGNVNDWSEWEKSKKRMRFLEKSGLAEKYGLENFISGKACDHYNRFREDFKLVKELGHNAHRFSIEWSRIEPEEGKFSEEAIAHYKEVVKTLRSLGIEPFVTLWHWTMPLWLVRQGGWENKKTIDYFTRFSEKMVQALGGEVKFWITINEPGVYAWFSYLKCAFPPQKKNALMSSNVLSNLIKAHKNVFLAIKKLQPDFKIGISHNMIYHEAYRGDPVNLILKKLADRRINFYFLNKIKGHQDFIGLNYYFHNRINYGFNKNENKIVSDVEWELYPEGIYHVLEDLKRYQKPIYITENGLADAADKNREWFIRETLKNIHRAIGDGADVKGYLHWSLMDNFEWEKGFWPRFGLMEIDYKTLERKPRPSAYFYRGVCLGNGI